jgi:hypothetical protein
MLMPAHKHAIATLALNTKVCTSKSKKKNTNKQIKQTQKKQTHNLKEETKQTWKPGRPAFSRPVSIIRDLLSSCPFPPVLLTGHATGDGVRGRHHHPRL